MTLDDIDQIVADIRLVATHVAKQPRGYALFEVKRAQIVLARVDVDALTKTLRSVLFVSEYYAPLTPTEHRIRHAAERLAIVLRTISANASEIQSRLDAA